MSTAAEFALGEVSRVRDDPEARLALMCRLYTGPAGRATTQLPYRRAAVAFMRWQLRRGLLRSPHGPRPGSPWWRAVNERLLRDGWEARALTDGYDPAGASASAAPTLTFIREPTAPNWYRAHNVSIVEAYLEHRDLAELEDRTERFFINLVLLRALRTRVGVRTAARPRPARACRPRARRPARADDGNLPVDLADPARHLPPRKRRRAVRGHRAPARSNPRCRCDPATSAAGLRLVGAELGQPGVRDLLADNVPCYAWPGEDRSPWFPRPTALARMARRVVPQSSDWQARQHRAEGTG